MVVREAKKKKKRRRRKKERLRTSDGDLSISLLQPDNAGLSRKKKS